MPEMLEMIVGGCQADERLNQEVKGLWHATAASKEVIRQTRFLTIADPVGSIVCRFNHLGVLGHVFSNASQQLPSQSPLRICDLGARL